ncbi:MAG TPA: Gfo/Idh/MocA family oxidoreductase [Chthoniobacteraceae bacterium]|nr:Gfo/Idh/MocA family oxidoreductase [Chthoniobacteraceae bacterium]
MAFQKSDGQNYAPQGKPQPVVKAGEFVFAAAALDHGHIYGQCNGLIEAGGELRYVYDPDPAKVEKFRQAFPQAQPLGSVEEVLGLGEVQLVASAAIPSERGPLGCRVLRAGKDYFTDKAPFTTLEQLADARKAVAETGKKYMVYYSERLHVEAAVRAGQLIEQGAIGRVVQVIGLGPHRSNPPSRPTWFWSREKCGGILIDIGSHQFEQFLYWTGAKSATVVNAAVANYKHKEFAEFEDWGEANLVADNGATNYVRVDWLNPNGLRTWGDGRTFILGTDGYIELRKYLNVAADSEGDHLFLVDHHGEQHIRCAGDVGFPFFGQLILDCIHRTENAMTQEHAFLAAELSIIAQEKARRIE